MADDRGRRILALDLVNQGLKAQQMGDLEAAVDLYRQSLELCPTAEGHTYLGWALSYEDKLDLAIEHCRRAIELDPEFGNPYNDIGVYMLQRGQLDEAVVWLERAKAAPRYEPKHYPYINLGHIYSTRGEILRAIAELEEAIRLAPDEARIRQHLEQLRRQLN